MEERRSYFTSAPFKFIVEGKQFFAHSGLISRFSEPLDRLINLDMKEKQQGSADLEDVTAVTFDRFLEWASKGYYTPPWPSIDAQSEEDAEEVLEHESEATVPEAVVPEVLRPDQEEASPLPAVEPRFWGDMETSSGIKKKKKKVIKLNFGDDIIPEALEESTSRRRENMREAFLSRQPVTRSGQIDTPQPRKNLSKSENYTEIFLCHARLYVFADQRQIQDLKTLALDELHALLAVFDLHKTRTKDILSLLRYGYANTGTKVPKESLRVVLTDYVGIEMDTLMLDDDFREAMIENGGDMLEDFMSVVMKRIKAGNVST